MDRLWHLLVPAYERRARSHTYGRAALWLILVVWSWHYFLVPVHDLGLEPGWMHGVHLIFHEAGHAITAMLTSNRPLMFFMGSGLQVLFPLIVTAAFYFKNRDGFSAALGLWWAAHAALDVAPYIADARALELPLLGGGTGREIEGHDWEFLLTHWDVLKHDTTIAGWVATIARVTMALAFLWAAFALIYEGWFLPEETTEEG